MYYTGATLHNASAPKRSNSVLRDLLCSIPFFRITLLNILKRSRYATWPMDFIGTNKKKEVKNTKETH
jgi:hypothetical protein